MLFICFPFGDFLILYGLMCYEYLFCVLLPLQIVQEFSLGKYDAEATAAFNQNVSDVSTMKERYLN